MNNKNLYRGPQLKGPSSFQLLRFPVLFGGILITLGVAFYYRDSMMADFVAERERMYAEHPETRRMVQEQIESMKRIH